MNKRKLKHVQKKENLSFIVYKQHKRNWLKLKDLMSKKFDKVVKDFTSKEDEKASKYDKNVLETKKLLQECEKPPFTIQRACELLLKPQAKSLEAFLFAFKKMFLGIVTTAYDKPQEKSDPILIHEKIKVDHPALTSQIDTDINLISKNKEIKKRKREIKSEENNVDKGVKK